MKSSYTAALFAFALFVFPVVSFAFDKDDVSRSSATSLDKTVGIYTVTVPVGGFNDDMYIPALGKRNVPHGERGGYFGYELESDVPVALNDGTSFGLLLGDAEVVDGMYKIPKGTKIDFTFVVFMTVSESESGIYRMSVTEFPFFMGEERASRHFTAGELKYLVTNYEALNFDRDVE